MCWSKLVFNIYIYRIPTLQKYFFQQMWTYMTGTFDQLSSLQIAKKIYVCQKIHVVKIARKMPRFLPNGQQPILYMCVL